MEIQLKRLRKEAGYKNRRDFATALGGNFTERRITSWENGERMMSLEQACVIADFLECSLDELAGRRFEATEAIAPDPAHRGLVESYDSLSEEGREVADSVMAGLRVTHPKSGDLPCLGQETA
ncbi:hypothetical protein Pcatena_04250 [Parolsenella catena]|uniref:HTH cro/C1-type domain-containing protein n=1 Tax=Parolsenella catena TaxID=2003188 RepID=A0A3G9JWN5_9ACTN|nr:helix-turn-helix transcriptional regulator [Parolsenella catena]BBH49838.1 hypothetical protein Pcatena_04250 [Parolsenella catena]